MIFHLLNRTVIREMTDKESYYIYSIFLIYFYKSVQLLCITKTNLYNFDPTPPPPPLKPHFYIVKLGFTGVYIIFLISAQKHRLWVLTLYVLSRNMKISEFFILKFSVFGGEIFYIFE